MEDNIILGLIEIGCENVSRIHLAQARVQWLDVVKFVTIMREEFFTG
jgi:hypothetical protein